MTLYQWLKLRNPYPILVSKRILLHAGMHTRTHTRVPTPGGRQGTPTSCFIWKFCTRLRSVNMRIVHRAVSRSDSSKSLKLNSVILRVWADGTTAALGKGGRRK